MTTAERLLRNYQELWFNDLVCSVCQTLSTPPVYSCLKGHTLCGACYESLQSDQIMVTVCSECGEFISPAHNHALEKILNFLQDLAALPDDPPERTNDYGLPVKRRGHAKFVSHRPVWCPNTGCERIIGARSILSHFAYDHKGIVQVSMDPGDVKHVTIDLAKLKKIGRCETAVVFVLPRFDGGDSESQASFRSYHSAVLDRFNIPFLLIAGRVPSSPGRRSDEDDGSTTCSSDGSSECFYRTTTLQSSSDLVLWICGNTRHEVVYSLEACDKNRTRRYSYAGPVRQIPSKACAVKMRRKSDCLVLGAVALATLTNHGQERLELRVVIS